MRKSRLSVPCCASYCRGLTAAGHLTRLPTPTRLWQPNHLLLLGEDLDSVRSILVNNTNIFYSRRRLASTIRYFCQKIKSWDAGGEEAS